MKLPNAEAAFIDMKKLRDYTLNPNHSRGKHKARLFASILSLTTEDADELRSIILAAIQQHDAVLGLNDQYGQRYIVDFPVTRQGQQANIRSIWITRPSETFPRLTSCYILRR